MELLAALVKIVVLSLALSAISMTIARSPVFEALRERISERSDWFGKLINCPYCTSHWLALGMIGCYRIKLVTGLGFLDYGVSLFALVALASFWSGIIYRAFAGMDD